jgi:hypothetical protein
MVPDLEENMPYDAEVIQRVLDRHEDATPKALARHCHLHVATVHRYLSGERTIPSSFLRGVFELTGDLQIIGLISGTVPIQFQSIGSGSDTQPSRIPPVDELLEMACKANELAAQAIPFMGNILKDGKIDAGDLQAIEQFKRHTAEATRCHGLVIAAIEIHKRKAGV